jgi:deoxyribonuclease I
MKLSIVLFSLLISLNLYSQSPNYYPESYNRLLENGSAPSEEIKNILFDILNKYHNPQQDKRDTLTNNCQSESCYKHRTLTYSEARVHLFGKMHLEKDNSGYFIQDVYCNKRFRASSGVGQGRIPNHNKINCEHTWPQSRFTTTFAREMQKSDLNHLFPTDTKANSTRGNHPFADVNGTSVGSNCNDSSVGSPINNRYSKRGGTYFEPPQEHKGNVARALFYFSVRYKISISETQERFLRNWHEEDPVDDTEVTRNDLVQEAQGNRNPFIDFPHLVEKVSDF